MIPNLGVAMLLTPHLPTSNNMRNTLKTAIKPLVQT